mmetsp:Transcript_12053/g.30950  ORF Transcript_12053/g.30950 Transcript_12053/m.30950 type:complete len:366 (+) Transcript_12053:157-1254(+)|eukprot:jgi/Tetstr1/426260/TSEL_016579.t1
MAFRPLLSDDPHCGASRFAAPDHNAADVEPRCCRICLEEDGHDLIAPCRCAGTVRWVHRSCLDRWRATSEDRAFSRCTECLAPYALVAANPPHASRPWRRERFVALVLRDFSAGFLFVQVVLGAVGFLLRAWDRSLPEKADGGRPVLSLFGSGCTDADRTSGRGDFFCHHTLSAYYLAALALALVVLGLLTLIYALCRGLDPYEAQLAREASRDACPCGCIVPDCSANCCSDCSRAGTADCSGGGCDDAHALLVGLAVMMLVVLLVTGILIAVIIVAATIQRIVQRHLYVLKKKQLSQDYVVADLSGLGAPPHHRRSAAEACDIEAAPSAPLMSAAGSTTGSCNITSQSELGANQARHLRKLGLL